MLAHRAGGAHCPSAPPTRPAIQRPTIIASTGGVLPVRLRLHATFGSTPDADGLEVQEGGPGPVSPAAAGAEAATAPSETAPAPQQQPFSWSKQWYAVAVADLTDPSRPAPLQLLGRSLVLWRDGAGDWRCFEDRCPHRAAPLSEGKIWEDGTLMCSYHGWRFQGGGACVRVPQAASPFAEQTACASQRSCASAHPVKQAQGLIFVWGEAGAEAAAEAELAPLPVDQLLAAAEGAAQNCGGCASSAAGGCIRSSAGADVPPAAPARCSQGRHGQVRLPSLFPGPALRLGHPGGERGRHVGLAAPPTMRCAASCVRGLTRRCRLHAWLQTRRTCPSPTTASRATGAPARPR
jgi:nitrite reductase/ring-hydroxylating ferredoxin subunit